MPFLPPKQQRHSTGGWFRAKGKKLYFGFVDLEKAFDRVEREVIRWPVCKLGVDEWLVLAVMQSWCKNSCKLSSFVTSHLWW